MIIGATLYVMTVTCHHTTFESNSDCHHHFFKVEFAIFRIFLATRSVLWPKICRKCDSGRGSALDPAGGAHDAPPDPLVGWGADTHPHTPLHSAPLAPRCSRLRRLDRRAPLTPNPDNATGHRHFLR